MDIDNAPYYHGRRFTAWRFARDRTICATLQLDDITPLKLLLDLGPGFLILI